MDFSSENKQNVKGCTVSKINSVIHICLENDGLGLSSEPINASII